MKIILATGNEHKKNEIMEIIGKDLFDLRTMKEENIDVEIIEDGLTFEDNALIKARKIREFTPYAVMADDSGLEVNYLDNAPGIYSARFSGEGATDSRNNEKLLELLKGLSGDDRKARFVCCVALITPEGKEHVFRGECPGEIAQDYMGSGGFGYDPIFLVDGLGKTYAQLSSSEKNSISHRARALKEASALLNELLGGEKR
ncbi:MAG: RdgB/HAM1 family non-canonical purine NTP pyrophosphatase [Eubacteriaceae bacterium]|nr:RdgB/HAM1 family non-canonical purine NTP pyrophosphatase [Eubacteriaceae bacterium]